MPDHDVAITRLPPRQARFVAEYLIDDNATQAAIRAGYSAKTAAEQGCRLLRNVQVAAAIQGRRQEVATKLGVRAEQVIEELARVGFADMADYLKIDDGGRVELDLANMPEGASRAIQELTQEERWEGKDEDRHLVRTTKFKLHPKIPALDLLGKSLALWITRQEHTGKDGAPLPPPVVLYLPQNNR